MPGYGKKGRREASSKIRSVPTSPLHAVLDELHGHIGIALWIIVLKHRAILWRRSETGKTAERTREEDMIERGKNGA